MPAFDFEGTSITITDEGFLSDHNQWTPELAKFLAKQVGIEELSDQHWQVITFCREEYASKQASPSLRAISKQSGVGMKDLYKLFPKGPGKLAAYVAGLPKPQGCV